VRPGDFRATCIEYCLPLGSSSTAIHPMLFDMLLFADFTLPLVLAQSGAAKTAVGWVIVMLLLLLALLVVARPSGRKIPNGKRR
jgi:hypothetical protein